MNDHLILLIAELEYTNRSVFASLDSIVDFETKDEKLACVSRCISQLNTENSEV